MDFIFNMAIEAENKGMHGSARMYLKWALLREESALKEEKEAASRKWYSDNFPVK